MDLEYHPEARREARESLVWYDARNPVAAMLFLNALDTAIQRILETPRQWPRYLHETRRYLMRPFPFSVVYLEHETTLCVVAIAHSSRKPGYWKERLDDLDP